MNRDFSFLSFPFGRAPAFDVLSSAIDHHRGGDASEAEGEAARQKATDTGPTTSGSSTSAQDRGWRVHRGGYRYGVHAAVLKVVGRRDRGRQ